MRHHAHALIALYASLLGACGDRDEDSASGARTIVTTDEHGRTVQVEAAPAPVAAPDTLVDLRARCDRNERAACGVLATFLLNAGIGEEAEEIWYRNCLAGHGPSCADLGYQYNNPYIRLVHPERALDVLTRGCEAAEHPPIACASLAERYSADAPSRYGTAPDPTRERALLERACGDGHYWSCDAIGAPPPP